jgi:hypothetical protein
MLSSDSDVSEISFEVASGPLGVEESGGRAFARHSAMPDFNPNLPTCPQCHARMRLVHSMESGTPYTGPTGGSLEVEINLLLESLASVEKGERSVDIHIYECPTCGPIYLTHEKSAGGDIDSSDRDSLVGAPRKPAPTINSSSIAVPEPDEDDIDDLCEQHDGHRHQR